MFDVTKIQTGLTGLVGIRQPLDPTYAILDATNLASRSGLYLDDIPNFKLKYYIDTQDYAAASNVDMNNHLRTIQDSAIVNVCNAVFGKESYIDRGFLYSHAMNRINVDTGLLNGFVGFKIKPSMTKNVAFKITRVRLEFQGAGDITLVLFNSALNVPMQTKTVTISQNTQLETLNWVVSNSDGDYKGEYYFGYIYDGTLQPFKRDYENSNIQNVYKEMSVEKVYVENGDAVNLFDLSQVHGLSQNTGLNPDITVYDDFTDMILQNEHLFAKAVQLSWVIDIMNRYVNSTRSNRNERLSKEQLMLIQAIEGTKPDAPIKVTGLRQLLGWELKSVRKEIKDLQRGYFGGQIKVGTLM